ncbi:hypothetical protein FQN51_004679 [Onygenales sp. PD_10]|nr:hypothetical protein FQN51_004679 [Onygenales sp. PD_10]
MLADHSAASFNVDAAVTGGNGMPPQQHSWLVAVSWVAVGWYLVVTVVCMVGWVQLQRHYSATPRKSFSPSLRPSQIPHVTIIRPVKGIEPYLYECLASSILQDYPRDKLTVYFCIATNDDPAHPVLKQLLEDFPHTDARIFVEEESSDDDLGPNAKIRNMSRAYSGAKGDIVWIVDCNVWVGKGVCGRMVDRLCGIVDEDGTVDKQYRFVHQMPIVVDVENEESKTDAERHGLLRPYNTTAETSRLSVSKQRSLFASIRSMGGGRLEEIFLTSSHAKFYSAINTVLIAPCVVGKSTMFRRSHLNYFTSPATSKTRPNPRRPGIDYFSDNICEDHLIGDCLWKGKQPAKAGEKWGKHSLLFGDLAIQPVKRMSVKAYIHRRIRWLRVRKFTVLAATLAEPGTESFLCSTYLALGLSMLLPRLLPEYSSHQGPWVTFFAVWLASVTMWAALDWAIYLKLHSGATIEADEDTPPFARPLPRSYPATARRPFYQWFLAWLGREALALPIWLCAFYGGSTVVWRDHTFKVGMDMIAREIPNKNIPSNRGSSADLPNLSKPTSYGTNGSGGVDIRQRSPIARYPDQMRN